MRGYAKIAPQFWFGHTGKRIKRLGIEAQLLAAYLMSGQHANMIGLYYLPVPYIAADTPLTIEGASKALRSLREVGFCAYDEESEVVWVYEMAKFQVGETLSPKDKQCKGVWNEYCSVPENAHLADFYEKYAVPFHLKEKRTPRANDEPTKSLITPIEAPSMILRSQEQEQETEQEQELPPDGGCRSSERPAIQPLALSPQPSAVSVPEDFCEAWNRLCGTLPSVREFTKSRRLKVKTRMAQGVTLAKWGEAVRKCAATAFTSGDNKRGWKASFDWLVENDSNLVSVLEGKYDDGAPAGRCDVPVNAWSDAAMEVRAADRDREEIESAAMWLSMSDEFKRQNPWCGRKELVG